MGCWIELKGAQEDPFNDPPEDVNRKTCNFERDATSAADIRGQLASYAAAHMDSCLRLHSISLLIFGKHGRFIRWDRSSAIVSEQFDYTQQPELLADFLWGVSHAQRDVLGMDPTVTVASDKEAELSRRVLQLPQDPGCRIHKAMIPSRDDPLQLEPYLLPAQPRKRTSPFGRAPRSTPAVKLLPNDRYALVWVKDSWRVHAVGLRSEGEIYGILEEANVPHICPFDRGNDLHGHQTQGHTYSMKAWACKPEAVSVYRHYRMSLSKVGRDLTSFNSTLEYTTAISHAIEGRAAYLVRLL